MSLYMSKFHIAGNHMSRLNYVLDTEKETSQRYVSTSIAFYYFTSILCIPMKFLINFDAGKSG